MINEKPTIYNEPGIYNLGGGGGGGGGSPEPAIIGNKVYRTCKIGNKIWLAENLAFQFAGLTVNPSGNTTNPAAYYQNNEYKEKYGFLYNWYALTYLDTNKDSLIPGWNLPTKDDYTELINIASSIGNPATVLKSLEFSGTDDLLFSAKLGGAIVYGGSYSSVGSRGYYFSKTAANVYNCNYMEIYTNATISETAKNNAGSLRLIKDA